MKIILLKDRDYRSQLDMLAARPAVPPEIEQAVAGILAEVREDGDDALCRFLEKFDKVKLTPEQFRVTEEELREAEKQAGRAARHAVSLALKNIRTFARLTKPVSWRKKVRPGVILGEEFHPMDRVACYVPGGTAPLVSTAIHTVGIAKAAGVRCVVAMTPPMKDGKVNPMTLYALKKAGADEIYKLGGAYAVGALAYGTQTIRKAEMIAGPGNAFVAAAKKLVYGNVAIDMVAGPSEVMVIADGSSRPEFAAADVLSQAEHGSGLERALLVSDSEEFIFRVRDEIMRQADSLKRQGPLRKVLENGVTLVQVRDMNEAAAFAGDYAPEHLEIHCRNAAAVAKKVRAAGALFIGEWTPEPAGDFTAGPSHVLPTGGTARFFHGLSAMDFLRRSSLVQYTQEALKKEIPAIVKFAEMEGLDAHGKSAAIRGKNND